MKLKEALDEIFELLDTTVSGKDTPFKNDKDKRIYESNLMFIYRRGEAANYHISSVKKQITIQEKRELPIFDDLKSKKNFNNIKANASVSSLSTEISNEFIAFLSAIRSGLDFMSKFMIRHIKGVQGDSLKTLLKLNKNNSNKLLLLIKQNEDWLIFLREYRNALIHNFNQVYHMKAMSVLEYGQSGKYIYPVVVSEGVPKFELDTREHRSLFDVEEKYQVTEMKMEFTNSSGKTVEIKREIKPANGHIEIREFMENQYKKYIQLFCSFLTALKEIDLKIIELKNV